jgi:para-nitrobenzyl esterase
MKAFNAIPTAGVALLLAMASAPQAVRAQAREIELSTADGVVQGALSADGSVRTFKGIPFAAPPVGALRWKAPQPVVKWTGVRKATEFGARCMQTQIYADMIFRDAGANEDCLYLNVWAPEGAKGKLPVMVWIYGGGYTAGGSSEPRQDGAELAKKGVVVVSMNYRLGIFGFFSHPELTKESPQGASGNYGLLDQLAAVKWVHENIAAFGGDAKNVTIFGESAGSFSVSAMVATPLAKGIVHKAIGESGAFFGETLQAATLADSEKANAEFAKSGLSAETLAALRAMPAADLLAAQSKRGAPRFAPIVDGYYLPDSPAAIYAAGKQNHVPLLAGWNLDEGSYRQIFMRDEATPENFAAHVKTLYQDRADDLLKVYPAAQAKRSGSDLAGDRFIAFATWKWLEAHLKTGQSPVYAYRFEQTMPLAENAPPAAEATAPHASEIEFVFRALPSKKLPWRAEDKAVSELMATYWTNFAKSGNPNGEGLPKWPEYKAAEFQVMHIKAKSEAAPDDHRARYLFLDSVK